MGDPQCALVRFDEPIDVSHLFISGEAFDFSAFNVDESGGSQASAKLNAADAAALADDAGYVTSLLMGGESGDDAPLSLDEIETTLLKSAVLHASGNLSAPARSLGITRAQLVYRLKTRGASSVHHVIRLRSTP